MHTLEGLNLNAQDHFKKTTSSKLCVCKMQIIMFEVQSHRIWYAFCANLDFRSCGAGFKHSTFSLRDGKASLGLRYFMYYILMDVALKNLLSSVGHGSQYCEDAYYNLQLALNNMTFWFASMLSKAKILRRSEGCHEHKYHQALDAFITRTRYPYHRLRITHSMHDIFMINKVYQIVIFDHFSAGIEIKPFLFNISDQWSFQMLANC